MVKIGNRTVIQSATFQTTQLENQESVPKQAQTAEANNVPTKDVSSENTWQRGGLEQDELMQKSVLNHKLTAQESYQHQVEQVEKNKEARSENGNRSFFGTIFGGPLIGTFVGDAISDKSDIKNKKDDLQQMIAGKNEEIKQLQTELDELEDSKLPDIGWLFGDDKGSEAQGVNQTTAKRLTPDPDND